MQFEALSHMLIADTFGGWQNGCRRDPNISLNLIFGWANKGAFMEYTGPEEIAFTAPVAV